jgi:hypothetical protein
VRLDVLDESREEGRPRFRTTLAENRLDLAIFRVPKTLHWTSWRRIIPYDLYTGPEGPILTGIGAPTPTSSPRPAPSAVLKRPSAR